MLVGMRIAKLVYKQDAVMMTNLSRNVLINGGIK